MAKKPQLTPEDLEDVEHYKAEIALVRNRIHQSLYAIKHPTTPPSRVAWHKQQLPLYEKDLATYTEALHKLIPPKRKRTPGPLPTLGEFLGWSEPIEQPSPTFSPHPKFS